MNTPDNPNGPSIFDPEMKSRLRTIFQQHEESASSSRSLIVKPTLSALPEYKYPRPDVDQFISDEYYLGGNFAPKHAPDKGVYDFWLEQLRFVLNPDNHIVEVLVQAAIGVGKTLFGLIAMLYWLCDTLCQSNPRSRYNIDEATPIVFFIFNITLDRVDNVCYKRLREMVRLSPFFRERMINTRARNEIVLPNNIVIEVGSQSRHALGSSIKVALLDETNFGWGSSHSDQGAAGQMMENYNTAYQRLVSRFMKAGFVEGQIYLLSSPGTKNDALNQHIIQARAKNIPSTHVIEAAAYEVNAYRHGKPTGQYCGKTFGVLVGDRYLDSRILGQDEQPPTGYSAINVPIEYLDPFKKDLPTALRDICNIGADPASKLIRQTDKLRLCIDPRRQSPFKVGTIYLDFDNSDQAADFLDVDFFKTTLAGSLHADYAVHVDAATKIDTLGLSMCHMADVVTLAPCDPNRPPCEEIRTMIVNDFTIGVKNVPGKVLPLDKIARFILWLRDSVGVSIAMVSGDSYEHAALMQPLMRAGMKTRLYSLDRNDSAYTTLRSTIYAGRLSLYDYEPLLKELRELNYFESERKVDHPVGGSKDLADALAGAVFYLTETEAKRGQESGPPIKYIFQKDIDREMRKRDAGEWWEEWGWIIKD